jgi:hypothetical protein
MAFDQNITYRVNVDDSNFQAKLSQMRASMDMTMGGMGGFGGMMPTGAAFGAMMAPFGGGYTGGVMSGLADFGAQIRPVTYTPPAIAMQPHFGMIALQQTTGQAMMGAMGPLGIGLQGAGHFLRHPFSAQPDVIPQQISAAEYMTLSSRAFATRAGDAAATGAYVASSVAASLVGGTIGGIAGTALGGPVGGFIGSVLGSQATDMVMGPVGTMMTANRAVQTQLEAGSFRFISGGPDVDPLTGRGFGRRARAEVADFIQSQELRDPRFGMGEMRQVLEGGMQMDLFSGTRDVQQFKERFSGLVSTLKTVTATLHTSLQEGMEVVRGMRDIGITDPGQVVGMTMKAETMGRMAGRTGSEMLAIGQAGAEIFRGTGIRMGLGFEANMQNATMVRQMLNQGVITRENIAQAGGENAMAQQMTASALASTQTAMGRGILMANFNPATGALDPNMATNMANRGVFGLLGRAAAMSPQAIMSFQARQEDVISQMNPMQLQLFGIQSDMMQARMVTDSISGTRRGTPEYQQALEDNFINAEKRRGVPIDIIKANMGMMKADPDKLKQDQEAAMATMGQQAAMEDIRNTYSLKRVTNALSRTFVQPLQREFTAISTAVGLGVERATMSLMGGTTVDSLFLGPRTMSMAQNLAQHPLVAAPTEKAGEVLDLRGSLYQRAVGGQTSGALAADIFKFGTQGAAANEVNFMGGTALKFKSEADVKAYAEREHVAMRILGEKNGEILAVSSTQEEKMLKRRDQLIPTAKDKEAAEKFKTSSETDQALQDMAIREEQTGVATGVKDISAVLMKEKGFQKLSVAAQGEVLARVSRQAGFTKAGEQIEAVRGKALANAGMATTAQEIQAGVKAGRAVQAQFSDIAGGGALKGALLGTAGVFGIHTAADDASRAIGKMNMDQFNQLAIVATDPTSTEGKSAAAALEAEGVSASVIKVAREDIHKRLMEKGQISDVKAQIAESQRAIRAGAATAEATGAAVTGAGVGEISKDTLASMRTMSDQLVKNMEMLIALQKQFNQLQGSR